MSGHLEFTELCSSIQKIHSNLILIYTNEYSLLITALRVTSFQPQEAIFNQ